MALKSGEKSLLETILFREQGVLPKSSYQNKVLKNQLNRLPHQPQPIEAIMKIGTFHYMRSNVDGELVGLNLTSNQFHTKVINVSRICVMKFSYNPSCVKGTKCFDVVSFLRTKKIQHECLIISDTADVQIHGKTPMLFCGNSNHGGVVVLSYFNCSGRNRDYEWKVDSKTYCCMGNDYARRYAIGCEEGYYLFDLERIGNKRILKDEIIWSLDMSNDGNFLILCSDKKGVSISDIREHECFRRYCSIKNEFNWSCRKLFSVDTSKTIVETKLLRDQVSLITLDTRGHLSKADLRMMRTVSDYEGHVGHSFRRNICLNEDLDLICAPGGDKLVRIWNLNSGNLIYKRNVNKNSFYFINDDPPHCAFLADQRRWFLSVVQDGVMIPVMPVEEFPDFPNYCY